MSDMTIEQEIMTEVQKLDRDMQRHILEIVRGLVQPQSAVRGEPGWKVVQHAREIAFPKEDLAEMAQAIEEWCERIDDFPEVNFDE